MVKIFFSVLIAMVASFMLTSCNGGGGGSSGSVSPGPGPTPTDATSVQLQTPLNETIGVGTVPTISFQFNGSVSGVSIKLYANSASGTSVAGVQASGTTGSNQYTFTPSSSLTNGGKYYTTITATSTSGSALTATYSFTVTPTPETPPSATNGAIYYHAFVPQTSSSAFADTMTLTGNNYTDVIISNYIAGAMLAHLIDKAFPGIHYNRNYIFGTMYGQWLQENLDSSLYVSTSNLLAPSPKQASVMGVGQGGPFQINAYYQDLVAGTYTPQGHSLINYVAIQKNIGYDMFLPPESQAAQTTKPTPAQFNDKYYGPMLTAYFHINDLLSLESLENGSQGYISSAAPNYPACMVKLTNPDMLNAPLDVIMNYAYNQGYYGGLDKQITDNCVNMESAAFLAMYNANYDMANGESGESSTYTQYPYQVRFYLDELSNSSTLSPTTTNNLSFNVQEMKNIFTYVYQTIWYVNSSNQYLAITPDQAATAFDSALTNAGVSISAVLDMSSTADRSKMFEVLADAISTLETNLGANFLQTSLTQLK